MPKFFSKDLAELTHQLTLSPRRLRIDQLRGIELLLELVEPDRVFPYEWVCFHITGYQKRGKQTSASVPGKALLADLVTMAEVISRKANLSVAELDEPYRTHQELADDLNVSTKTIRRWRNRGLMGIRVVFEDGVNRLAFCQSTIDRFVVRHRDLVKKGAAFRQLTEAERAGIVQRAGELLAQRPLKLHAVSKLIAEETGRAVETVRYTLRRHEESTERPLFAADSEPILSDRFRALWRCHKAGEDTASLARAFECSVEEVESILRHVQVTLWREVDLSCIHNEIFDAPNADDLVLGVPEPAADPRPGPKPPESTPTYLRALYKTPLLTRAQEQDLFRRYNYLKYRTNQVLARIDTDSLDAATFDHLSRSMAAIEKLRQRIIRANLRLVVSIARKHIGWSVGFFEVVSDGNISLMRAVEKFDFARGVKFSTYASWAIMKNFARTIPEQHYRAARYVTGQDELLEAAPDPSEQAVSSSDRDRLRAAIADGLMVLDDREREIVSSHFGLGQNGNALTLEQLGRRFGVTKERVRQIEKRALVRLRDVLPASLLDVLPQ
ncbi:MAG: sigma-70 family RNA polymerase sigma factor [Phycisphaerae bacterium]